MYKSQRYTMDNIQDLLDSIEIEYTPEELASKNISRICKEVLK